MNDVLLRKPLGKPFDQWFLLRSPSESQTYLHVPRCSRIPRHAAVYTF
jgi:hypothetical protein